MFSQWSLRVENHGLFFFSFSFFLLISTIRQLSPKRTGKLKNHAVDLHILFSRNEHDYYQCKSRFHRQKIRTNRKEKRANYL